MTAWIDLLWEGRGQINFWLSWTRMPALLSSTAFTCAKRSPWQCGEQEIHPGQLQWEQMFGSNRRCTDQLSKCGTTEQPFSTRVPHLNLPFFHVNIGKVNADRNPHTCELSHTHVKSIIKSVLVINVYSVPDAKMIISHQSGPTGFIFAFLTFKSLSSCPLPPWFRFNFILAAFLVVIVWTAGLPETKNFCFLSCWTNGWTNLVFG